MITIQNIDNDFFGWKVPEIDFTSLAISTFQAGHTDHHTDWMGMQANIKKAMAALNREAMYARSFRTVVSSWIQNDFISMQFRFPKSKKKRIRKKWTKRPFNFKMKEFDRIIFDKENMTVYGNQKAIDNLNKRYDTLRRR